MRTLKPSDATYQNVKLREGIVRTKIIVAGVDDRFRFDCLRCGDCCSLVPDVNPREASRMANYLHISKRDFFREYLTLKEDPYYGWHAELDEIGGNCTFYRKEKGKGNCMVNPVKPWQCRSRPITILDENFDSIKSSKIAVRPCRGMGRGPERTVDDWIKKNSIVKSMKYDLEYVNKVLSMKKKMTREQLRTAVTEMFINV